MNLNTPSNHQPEPPSSVAESFSRQLLDLAMRQADWSQRTFGTDADRGPIGAIKHLKQECDELLEAPDDPAEYADALLLILDASRRAGLTIGQLITAARDKQAINEKREWPTPEDDEPVLHNRQTPHPAPGSEDGDASPTARWLRYTADQFDGWYSDTVDEEVGQGLRQAADEIERLRKGTVFTDDGQLMVYGQTYWHPSRSNGEPVPYYTPTAEEFSERHRPVYASKAAAIEKGRQAGYCSVGSVSDRVGSAVKLNPPSMAETSTEPLCGTCESPPSACSCQNFGG